MLRRVLGQAILLFGGQNIPGHLCAGGHNQSADFLAQLCFHADQFRLDRYPRGAADADHVAFASGIHLCLGAHLARLEAEVMFDQLAERMASFTQTGPVVWGVNPSIRGIKHLPVRLEAR